MNELVNTSWTSGVKKRYVVPIAICLALCVFAAAYIVCRLEYDNAEKRVLANQESALVSWVSGTVEAGSLWAQGLEAQAKRVSSSELYRLFAEDVQSAGGAVAAQINDTGISDRPLPEGAAVLAEQIPLMRNLLLDFMNFNGLSDARLVNAQGLTLLSGLAQPSPLSELQKNLITRAIKHGAFSFGPVRSAPGGLVLDYADPLEPVMDDSDRVSVGALLLTTPVTGYIAQLMGRDTHAVDSMRPRLVQKTPKGLEEIQVRGTTPSVINAEHLQPTSSTSSASSADAGRIIAFAKRRGLEEGTPVYSYGRLIPELNWYVLLEVPASTVDASLRNQAWMIYGIGGLISIGIVLLCSLLWWIMIGRQQRVVAEGFERLYRVIKQQKQLLDSVNVSLDVGLLMASVNGQIQVCNRAFAGLAQREEQSVPGENILTLFDSKTGARLLEGMRSVVERHDADTIELSLPALTESEGERLFRVSLYPFEDHVENEEINGAVAIFQDITEFRRNSERRRTQQLKTISALVRAIESVDPYLTGHSQRMTELADLVSRTMNLSDRDNETIRAAASLSQMGKLFVPRALLAKSGQLSQEEQTEIMRAPTFAYNMLRDIDFGLPVPQAVYEMSERMDGKGYPQQLRGEAISIHARVLAAVNALCAMVSPRSYRSGMSVNDALQRMRADTSFDPTVVDALARVLASPEGLRAATPAPEE